MSVYPPREAVVTKAGPALTATVSHSVDPEKNVKARTYLAAHWGPDVTQWALAASDGDQVTVVIELDNEGRATLHLRDQPMPTPIPTDRERVDALARVGGFVNPYTFIPTPTRAPGGAALADVGLGDSGPGGPPSHALHTDGQWAGVLRLRLTTLTPLLLPDTQRPGTDREGRASYDVRTGPDGRPAIPPTSLKGALRSAFEAITASRFGVFAGHDGRLAYRIPASAGLTPAVVEADPNGTTWFRLCDGDRTWTRPGQGLNRVQAAAWVPAYKGQARHLALDKQAGNLHSLHEKAAWARVRLYKYQRPGQSSEFHIWRLTHLSLTEEGLARLVESRPGPDPVNPTKSLRLVAEVPKRIVQGRLSVTGPSIDTKHDERFFVLDDDDHRVRLENEHREFWVAVLNAYTEAKEYNAVPEEQRSRHVTEAARLLSLPPGTSVYVTYDRTAGHVTGVYPVMVGRQPFDRSPLNVLDPSVRPAGTLAELSPADRLFGWVSTTADRSRDGRRPSSGYRGHLAVGPIRCTTDGWRPSGFPPDGVVLAPLSSPKPTQFRFYSSSDDAGSPVPRRAPKETGYQDGTSLRGRKAYRWSQVPAEYWQPTSDQQDFAKVGDRYREYLDPKAPVSQTSRHRSWVRQGVTFEVDLFLDGVPTPELGALLWLASRGEQAPLRLGAGKPHGFGVLACDVVWPEPGQPESSASRLWDGDGVAAGWRDLRRPEPAGRHRLEQLATDFEQVAATHPVLAETITSYLAAAAPVTDAPVHYPRSTAQPEAESYRWFVANERKAAKDEGWSLPHVREPDQRLPRLPTTVEPDADPRSRPGGGQRGSGPGNRPGSRPGGPRRR